MLKWSRQRPQPQFIASINVCTISMLANLADITLQEISDQQCPVHLCSQDQPRHFQAGLHAILSELRIAHSEGEGDYFL